MSSSFPICSFILDGLKELLTYALDTLTLYGRISGLNMNIFTTQIRWIVERLVAWLAEQDEMGFRAVLTSLLYFVQVKVCQLYNNLNGCFDRIYIAWKDFIEGNESTQQLFQKQIGPVRIYK